MAAAVRVCTEAVRTGGQVSATLPDAQAVVDALVQQALEGGALLDPLERKRAAARTRQQRCRANAKSRAAAVTVTDESPDVSRRSHAPPRDRSVTDDVTSSVTGRDIRRDAPPLHSPLSDPDLPLNSSDSEQEEREISDAHAPATCHAAPSHGERDHSVTASSAPRPRTARETSPNLTVREQLEREHPGIVSAAVYQRVSEQLAAVTRRQWDVQGYLRDWAWLAGQRADEWALVLRAIGADEWCQQNAGKVSPAHLRRRWPAYSEPPKPPTRPRSPHDNPDADRQMREDLARDAAQRSDRSPLKAPAPAHDPDQDLEAELAAHGGRLVDDADQADEAVA